LHEGLGAQKILWTGEPSWGSWGLRANLQLPNCRSLPDRGL